MPRGASFLRNRITMYLKIFRKYFFVVVLIIALSGSVIPMYAGGSYLVRRIDDGVTLKWQEINPTSMFFDYHKKEVAIVQTSCRMVYDNRNLYLQVICQEPNPASIKTACKVHDGSVWKDDCVEIFLDPSRSHKKYFQFVSNALGVMAEGYRAGAGKKFVKEWDGAWKVTASVLKDSWVCEVEIPFDSLNVSTPKAGEIWGSNICRERHSGNVFELSSWSLAKNFHNPRKFGRLVFETFDPELKRQLERYEPDIVQYRQYAGQALLLLQGADENDYHQKFEQMENEWARGKKQYDAVDITLEQFIVLMAAFPRLSKEYKDLAIELQLEGLF